MTFYHDLNFKQTDSITQILILIPELNKVAIEKLS